MVVDFEISKCKGYRIVSAVRVGGYSGDNMMKPYFAKIKKWIAQNRLQSGVWMFRGLDEDEVPDKERRFEASIEIKGRKPSVSLPKGLVINEIPATPIARVKFDPTIVADRVIYHGLESWLEWRKRYGEYETIGPSREVYSGDPWASGKAWKSLEIQVPLKKIKA